MDYAMTPTTQEAVAQSRANFIDRLPYPVELHLEWLARDGRPYRLEAGGETAGHCIVADDGALVEFHLDDRFVPHAQAIFDVVAARAGIKQVWLHSFDGLCLRCCLDKGLAATVAGHCFRDFLPTPAGGAGGLVRRAAGPGDFAGLLAHADALYESEEQLRHLLANGMLHLYHEADRLVGCGYLIRVRPDRDWRDLGMWVPSALRRRGYARRIVADLKDWCLREGWRPCCGCAADNVASRRALEANGFVSRHAVLSFALCPPGRRSNGVSRQL